MCPKVVGPPPPIWDSYIWDSIFNFRLPPFNLKFELCSKQNFDFTLEMIVTAQPQPPPQRNLKLGETR